MNAKTWILTSVVVISLVGSSLAIFMPPSYLPADRLITNTQAYIDRHPDEPMGYYVLARIHYLAFVNQVNSVPGFGEDQPLPNILPYWQSAADYQYAMRLQHAQALILAEWGVESINDIPWDRRIAFDQEVYAKEEALRAQGWKPETLNNAQVLAHAILAHVNFEKAMDLDPENGLYFLGLASLLEQYRTYGEDANLPEYLPQLGSVTVPRLRMLYYLAYRLSVDEDMTWEYIPLGGLRSLVAYEAGQAYLRLAKEKPGLPDTPAMTRVQQDLDKFETLPWGPITPIIFSMQRHKTVLDLLSPETEVRFDLDGDGAKEDWPWLRPDTGLLVWDPDQTGKIRSGRQLFGSSSWWLLFPNGYFALSVLDDNRDGSLTQGELKGIAVWFDTNGDGQSDPGEVTPVEKLGVTSIYTNITGRDMGMPMNSKGITFQDGQTVPTYDWVTQAATPALDRSLLGR